jgi:small subunit ribosomal protein S4
MGKVRKLRKNYVFHKQRWNKKTIEDEKELVKNYALKNKKEIRRVEFLIKKFKKRAKLLNKTLESKTSKEAKDFLNKLKHMGVIEKDVEVLDIVLDLQTKDILERRLSNIVYKKKLSRTSRQARQFITHCHVKVNDRVITSPSYLVSVDEEEQIKFYERSALKDENHPERSMTSEKKTVEIKLDETSEPKEIEENKEEVKEEEKLEVKN